MDLRLHQDPVPPLDRRLRQGRGLALRRRGLLRRLRQDKVQDRHLDRAVARPGELGPPDRSRSGGG
jgi:hypothetical protein